MSLDTPATIAIIGAGSVGIEAALYARFLGYDVQVFERDRVGANLLDNEGEDQRRPVGRCCSPLGLRALMAQDPNWSLPDLETLWTPREFVENYLAPLSRTDLLDGHVVEQTEVTDVRRTEAVEEDAGDDESAQVNDDPQEDELENDNGEFIEEAPRLPPLRVTAQRIAPSSEPPASSLKPQALLDADIVIDASGSMRSGPDYRFVSALRFERCPQTARPLPSAADSNAGAAGALVLAEPNFYILGSKSRGRESGFEIVDGLRQIRDLFGLIGGRATLDLYQDLSQYRTQPDGGEP